MGHITRPIPTTTLIFSVDILRQSGKPKYSHGHGSKPLHFLGLLKSIISIVYSCLSAAEKGLRSLIPQMFAVKHWYCGTDEELLPDKLS